MSQAPEDIDRLIQETLTQLGWEADPNQLATRVKRLDLGLPYEDEFSIVCSWLGHCELIHKLDQKQTPKKSRDVFQVPDLLAVFRYKNRSIPVLVEVKSSKQKTLSFRPDYLERLQKYAELVRLPVLIAWKYLDFWILFDTSHLQKARTNFNIGFNSALRENLLGLLAGDFSYSLSLGAGMHMRFRLDTLLSEMQTEGGKIEQHWNTTLDDVSFTDGVGRTHRNLDAQTQALFFSWNLEQEEVQSPGYVIKSYVARDSESLFAHMALVRLLDWQQPSGDKLNWRRLLSQSPVLHGISDFTAAIRFALQLKFVHHVIHQVPMTIPPFLT